MALSPTTTAFAETSTVEGGLAPIVRIVLPTQASLTVRTWDREAVQIDGDAAGVTIDRKTGRMSASSPPVLIRMVKVQRGDGQIVLPAETYVVSGVAPGDHDLYRVSMTSKRALGAVTVTVPNDSAAVYAAVDRGSVTLRDYRGGTFIVHVRNGSATLQNVGGDGFVQVLQGTVQASDSTFDRLRVRMAVGNQIFQRCRSRQIEAWSAEGSVVYDSGSFDPGLARFESTDGNVVIGVNAGTQLVGRTGSGGGKVYTLFDRGTQVDERGGEANANYAGGGPLVNAFSGNGSVYLYDGGLAIKRKLPPEWRPALLALRNDPNTAIAPRHEQPNTEMQTDSLQALPHSVRRPHGMPGPGSVLPP
jgi:hypothetical protein